MHECAHFDDDFGGNDDFLRWTFRHFGSKEPKRDIESGIKIAWSENGMENRHKINLSSFEWDAEFYDKAVIICPEFIGAITHCIIW